MASESGSVVLRIKRKRTEDPLDALLVAQVFKKPHIEKNEDNDKGNAESKEDLLSSTVERVFKFVGSVPQGDDLKKKDLLAKIHKQCLGHENLMKSHIPDQQTIQERLRQKKKLLNQESRFKVISSLRGSVTDSSSDQGCKTTSSGEGSSSVYSPSEEETVDEVDLEVQRLLSVFDVVKDEVQNSEPKREQRMLRKKQQLDETRAILCNSVKMIREKLTLSQEPKTQWRNPEKEGYVYDFYYPSDNYGRLGDIVEVLPFDSELVHESLMDDFGEIYDDDDDSNDEGNWRNDYPDEEDNLSDSSQERRFFGDYGFDSDEEYRRYAFDDNLSDGD